VDQLLSVFTTVADERNFSRAAEKLHMTQPAVSQHIQGLERRLHAKLLERNNKFVRLTRAGELVYYHATEILTTYARMERLLDDMMQRATGNLLIGASYTYGEYVLPHALGQFRKQYPEIQPSIVISNTRDIVNEVGNGNLDIGIVEGTYVNDRVITRPLVQDRLHIIVSAQHPLASQADIAVADLCAQTWIVREEGSGTREVANSLFAAYSITPDNLMEFGSTQVVKESVEAGLGISIMSESAIRKELLLQTLFVLPFPIQPIVRQFTLVTRNTEFETKALTLFCDFLQSWKSEKPRSRV